MSIWETSYTAPSHPEEVATFVGSKTPNDDGKKKCKENRLKKYTISP